jgi:heme-degrading monooxygenase HmoA
MHARTGELEVAPERIDAMVSALVAGQIPTYRTIDGYRGFRILANRATGKVIGMSLWETEEAMRASEEQGAKARAQAAEEGHGTEVLTEYWEIVLEDEA